MDKHHPGEKFGTTSACAENTFYMLHRSDYYGNYLRVRGEYYMKSKFGVDLVELPPRARRIPMDRAKRPVNSGTTSACAENTP